MVMMLKLLFLLWIVCNDCSYNIFFQIIPCINSFTHLSICRPLGYERVYLPLCKVADTPFNIQGGGGDMSQGERKREIIAGCECLACRIMTEPVHEFLMVIYKYLLIR